MTEIVARLPRSRGVFRRLQVLVLLAGLGYGGYHTVRTRLTPLPPIRSTWFAPYVDVTLTPTYQFQSSSADPARQAVLGFVVASPRSGCAPSWGGAYTLTGASQSLSLGSRIAQLQQDGAEAIVSFGGQKHTSLDVACTSVTGLTAAYQSVISRYQLSTIDLDIEGAALDDFAAGQRRAAAIAALEQSARAQHRRLGVWLTLPAEPSGLQDNALSVIRSMLRARVPITGVNVMTMDFAQPPAAGTAMLQQVREALDATHAQLAGLLPRYGVHLQPEQIWQRLGATVMIGQNDIAGQIVTVDDAKGVAAYVAGLKK
jgi:chitinase